MPVWRDWMLALITPAGAGGGAMSPPPPPHPHRTTAMSKASAAAAICAPPCRNSRALLRPAAKCQDGKRESFIYWLDRVADVRMEESGCIFAPLRTVDPIQAVQAQWVTFGNARMLEVLVCVAHADTLHHGARPPIADGGERHDFRK